MAALLLLVKGLEAECWGQAPPAEARPERDCIVRIDSEEEPLGS